MKTHLPKAIFMFLLFILTPFGLLFSQEMERRTYWGANFNFSKQEPGAEVSNLNSSGSMAKTGLQEKDRIIRINNIPINNEVVLARFIRQIKMGDDVRFVLKRKDSLFTRIGIFSPYPLEEKEGVKFSRQIMVSEQGDTLSTLISTPVNKAKNLPAILLIQWLSCTSVEASWPNPYGFTKLLQDLSKKGFLVMRVDKPGVGDSKGPDCSEYGFFYEQAIFGKALKLLKNNPSVDSNQVFLLGYSNGGVIAPMIATQQQVKGIIVSGCSVKTWHEHMVEFERKKAVLADLPVSAINQKMRLISEFYTLYLIKKQSPAEIINKYPHLSSVWDESLLTHQYGRPVRYFQELNDTNPADYWEKLTIPVLSIYGEFDFIMSKEDHEIIAAIANQRKKGNGTFYLAPKANHQLNLFSSQKQAFSGNSFEYDESIADMIVEWTKKMK